MAIILPTPTYIMLLLCSQLQLRSRSRRRSHSVLLDRGWAATGLAACGGCLLMLGNLSMQRALLMKVSLSIVLPISRIPTDVRSTSLIGEVRRASAAWAP